MRDVADPAFALLQSARLTDASALSKKALIAGRTTVPTMIYCDLEAIVPQLFLLVCFPATLVIDIVVGREAAS